MTTRDIGCPHFVSSFQATASRGLFVGINLFKDEDVAPLHYAVDDAVDLAFLFSCELDLIQPQNVSLALSGSPVKSQTADKLSWLRANKASFHDPAASELEKLVYVLGQKVGSDGLWTLSFATHGFHDRGQEYLAARDAWPLRAASGSILVPSLIADVASACSPRRLLLLDTCRNRFHSGARGQEGAAMTTSLVEAIAQARGTCVLNSTALGGVSFEDSDQQNGVFTAAIVRGLRDGAAAGEGGLVTIDSLAKYVDREVVRWVQARQPSAPTAGPGITIQADVAVGAMPLAAISEREVAARHERLVRALSPERARRLVGGSGLTQTLSDEIARLSVKPSPLSPDEAAVLAAAAAWDGTEERTRAFFSTYDRLAVNDPHLLFRSGLKMMTGLEGVVDWKAACGRFLAAAASGDPVYSLWVDDLRAGGRCSFNREAPAGRRIGAEELDRMQAAAQGGDRDAALVLADCFANGVGVPVDKTKAMRLATIAAADRDPVAINLMAWLHGSEGRFAEALEAYRSAASLGNASALFNLGALHESGRGVPMDATAAADWYRQAAQKGEPRSMTALGTLCEFGRGLPLDQGAARHWYEEAARAGDATALAKLGWMHYNGDGTPPDPAAAIQLFERSVAMGDTFGMRSLAAIHADGKDVPMDYAKAFALWHQAAALGDGDSMASLGECAEKGLGGPADVENAAAWYRQAAEKGSVTGMTALGRCYEFGRGLPQDLATARHWLQKGADAGDATALGLLGILHQNGRGGPVDLSAAIACFEKAVALGNARGMLYLGLAYEDGKGVPQDLKRSKVLWRQAADLGEPVAMVFLAQDLDLGIGAPADAKMAAAWYRKAEDMGNGEAAYGLAQLYLVGRGVRKDSEEAARLFKRARELGYSPPAKPAG